MAFFGFVLQYVTIAQAAKLALVEEDLLSFANWKASATAGVMLHVLLRKQQRENSLAQESNNQKREQA